MPSYPPRPEPPVLEGLTMITPRPQSGGFSVWEFQHGTWRIFDTPGTLAEARRVARKQQRRLWPYYRGGLTPSPG